MEYSSDHFRLLRQAWLRRLEVRKVGDDSYNVSSYGEPGAWYHIRIGLPCPCKAVEYCTHLAKAVNEWALDNDRFAYVTARERDLSELLDRSHKKRLHRDDRLYRRCCMRTFAAKYEGVPTQEAVKTSA